MEFEAALRLLKLGYRVRRETWTELQFIHMALGSNGIDKNGGPLVFRPCVTSCDKDGVFQQGWVPTQADMLSGADWEVVPRYENKDSEPAHKC